MIFSITVAQKEFSQLLRRAHEGPVVITRRGQPDVVLLAHKDYQRLRRMQAYEQMLRIAAKLRDSGVKASDIYQASRSELEARP